MIKKMKKKEEKKINKFKYKLIKLNILLLFFFIKISNKSS